MITVALVLAVAAFVCAILAAVTPKVPIWVAVILLCVIELLRSIPLRVVLPIVLALSFGLTACGVCREDAHRNDLSCWVQNEIISCGEDSVVPEVMPIVLQLISALATSGSVDWAALETTFLKMGVRDGGCLIAALEQRFGQAQASLGEQAMAPKFRAMLVKNFPRYSFRLVDGTMVK